MECKPEASNVSDTPDTGRNIKNNHLRILSVNCQSLRNKLARLKERIQCVKPDVITGCESWLEKGNSNAEVLPEGYNKQVIRHKRNKYGGGVFIAAKNDIKIIEVKTSHSDCEVVWGEIQTTNG